MKMKNPFKVGDRVRHSDDGAVGEVVRVIPARRLADYTFSQQVWVRFPDGMNARIPLKCLSLVSAS
jgi:hypothetical protein